jgi:magnesium-transporting ATPase (P-type)
MNQSDHLPGFENLDWLLLITAIIIVVFIGIWLLRLRQAQASHSEESEQLQAEAKPWHAETIEAVIRELNSSLNGLTPDEAGERLQHYGPNRLPEVKPRSAWVRFFSQFHNVLIYVLLAACLVTSLLEHWLDSAVILGVVVINAIIGFIQEGKAEDALAAIRQMLSPKTMVLRHGKRLKVPAEDLVPGDIVPLQAGDKVVADLRVLQAKGLHIDEAALTGESVPVDKSSDPIARDAVLADRTSMAYSGTLVTAGQGLGLVTATATHTELGRISALVAGVEQLTTPLLLQMAQFGRWLTAAIILLATFTFAFGVLIRDYTASQMFLAAVGLAVAAIPEGLPAIMTITLAIGVQRMAANQAIIRRLPAVETLGTLSVICSDKTGTMTKNQMTVRRIALLDRELDVSGTGYDPHGGFLHRDQDYPALEDPTLTQALRAVILCNDGEANLEDGEWRIQGDPMEAALIVAGIKAGLEPDQEIKRFPRTDLIPFDSKHKFMATLHHNHRGEGFVFIKGAPEQILSRCAFEQTFDSQQELRLNYWEECVEALGSEGFRVLAVAMKRAAPEKVELEFADIDDDLLLLGLFALIDPARDEVVESVSLCRTAGIRVKMITGDHRVTAMAIAKKVGLVNSADSLTGQELEQMPEEVLAQRVNEVDVYARVTPEHKLRLVSLLQQEGKVVSMTGDGVNDAPALKRADVGVAMGGNGTEVAKDASEMVLADDNFSSIVNAVREGRTVYDNLKKAILFILPTNGGEALVMLGAIVLGFQQLPLTPVQILWVNMITAVTLALALAFEPPEQNIMQRPPRNPREAVLSRLFIWRIAYVSVILTIGTFGLFQWELSHGSSIEMARTVAVNTLVAFEIFYLFNSRYVKASVLNLEGLLGNRLALIAVGLLILFQLAFTYLGPLQNLFGTAPMEPHKWLTIILVASSVLWLVELEKFLMSKYRIVREKRRKLAQK